MKPIFYTIIALVLLTSCTQTRVVITEAELPEDLYFRDDAVKPFTGRCVIYYYGTEIVKEELTYKKGLLHGLAVSYYKNGNIKRQGKYVNGRIDGKWESWYENGQKNYELTYKNDTLYGDYITWYPTGVIKARGLYAQNGRTGVWTEYDEAGMILKKQNFE